MDIKFDYYNEHKEDFYGKFNTETVWVSGEHYKEPPLITVLIPTYKRTELLELALNSAIDQSGFSDYQIIVVDNEGEDINKETPTSNLMKKYEMEKVVYYRHKKSVDFKMDNAVKLARSRWIVFLHDDDQLSRFHLSVLTGIAKNYPKARYISCPMRSFKDGEVIQREDISAKYKYVLRKRRPSANCLGYFPGWLGALIDREAYISTGGMPTLSTGLGDFIMGQKFHYRYGIYEVIGNEPLYFYRIWPGQDSGLGNEHWMNTLKNEYEYFKYVDRKFHPLTYRYWDRIGANRTLGKARDVSRNFYNCEIDLEKLCRISGMSDGFLRRDFRYKVDVAIRIFYEKAIDRLLFTRQERGQICLY